MANPNSPGKFDRAAMFLKAAVVDIDWFYFYIDYERQERLWNTR